MNRCHTLHLSGAAIRRLALVAAVGILTGADAAVPASAAPRVTGPHVYENLDLYLVHASGAAPEREVVPLARALEEKRVVVRETGNVSQLTIENLSDKEVFVQAGDIVKGGRQDRVLGSDLVLPPGSGPVAIRSNCVESGRFSPRAGEASDRFESSQASATGRELKIANRMGAQGEVWNNVSKVQEKLQHNLGTNVRSEKSASSLQLTLENDRVRQSADAYEAALSRLAASSPDVVGFAFAVNGEINSAEVYASHDLFVKVWPKLLRAAATEAVAERKSGVAHTPPTLEGVITFLAAAEGDGKIGAAGPAARTVTRESATRLVVETQVDGKKGSDGWLHRSYLRK
jgi:hypothetical protein